MGKMDDSIQTENNDESALRLTLQMFVGFFSVCACHLLQLPLLTFQTGRVIFLFFSVTQFVYVIPLYHLARRKKSYGFMIGVIMAAAMTFMFGLPHAGCGLMEIGLIENPLGL